MLKEAIILAGGKGLRLKSLIDDRPKPMALINGKPFLEYLLIYLQNQGIRRVIFSVGYKSDLIIQYFGNHYHQIEVDYSYETEPLGTGGAILKSAKMAQSEHIFVLNGDTFFKINYKNLYQFHLESGSELTLALKKIEDGSRYGSVITDDKGKISGFSEKQLDAVATLINGGIYVVSANKLIDSNLPEKFSFEKDFLEKKFHENPFFAKEFNDYFIDIGIPETFQQAQSDFRKIFIL